MVDFQPRVILTIATPIPEMGGAHIFFSKHSAMFEEQPFPISFQACSYYSLEVMCD